MNENLGIYGAKRQTWLGNSARAILRKVRMRRKNADIDALVNAMVPLIKEDEEALKQILAYWVPRNLISLEQPTPAPADPLVRQKKKEAEAAEIETVVSRVKDALIDTVMGSTFGDLARLAKAAPRLAAISKMGKP